MSNTGTSVTRKAEMEAFNERIITIENRLANTEQQIVDLKDRLQKAEVPAIKQVKKENTPIGNCEMTPDQYMASRSPTSGIRYAGPVPLTEDGRCIDPAWKKEGDFMVQRNLSTKEIVQKVAIIKS